MISVAHADVLCRLLLLGSWTWRWNAPSVVGGLLTPSIAVCDRRQWDDACVLRLRENRS